MKPLYLKFETEEAARKAIALCSDKISVDTIGAIYNEDGEFDEETGEWIKKPTEKEGWHVNVLAPDTCNHFKVDEHRVITPIRVWAGFENWHLTKPVKKA